MERLYEVYIPTNSQLIHISLAIYKTYFRFPVLSICHKNYDIQYHVSRKTLPIDPTVNETLKYETIKPLVDP